MSDTSSIRCSTSSTRPGAGRTSRCLAHETDHVNGHVYLDRLSGRDRKEALRQVADRREDVLARRAANIEALNGAQGAVSASGSGPAPTPTPR